MWDLLDERMREIMVLDDVCNTCDSLGTRAILIRIATAQIVIVGWERRVLFGLTMNKKKQNRHAAATAKILSAKA